MNTPEWLKPGARTVGPGRGAVTDPLPDPHNRADRAGRHRRHRLQFRIVSDTGTPETDDPTAPARGCKRPQTVTTDDGRQAWSSPIFLN